jgi:hypothetical protein
MTDNSNLLAGTLDDIEDIPGFETPPPGSYILEVTTDVKEVKGKHCVEANFTVIETVELVDHDAKPVIPGTKFSTLFQLDNIYGKANLKKFMTPFADALGTRDMIQLVAGIRQLRVSCSVGNRPDKNGERIYAEVGNITVG